MNYEKKFTPGPWVSSNEYVIQDYGINGHICQLSSFPKEEAFNANAHLIAAAPELLDALIDVLEWAESCGLKYTVYDACKSAINKALNIKNDEL